MPKSEANPLEYKLTSEDGIFVARCPELDIASDGLTESEAMANLEEALALYFQKETYSDD